MYAHELMRDPDNRWPDLLLMLGDQVYVDEGSPETREFIRSRRDVSEPPGEEVLDFEEYTRLYHESWREPYVRWLFSTVPSAMVIDDHDISDDWNISRSWKEEMDRKPWWHQRVEAGYMTYWIYQHLGNLSPERCPRTRPTPKSGSRATTPGPCFATTRGGPTRIARGSGGATAATSATPA